MACVGTEKKKKQPVKEIMAEIFPNLIKTINPQVQEGHQILNTRNMFLKYAKCQCIFYKREWFYKLTYWRVGAGVIQFLF